MNQPKTFPFEEKDPSPMFPLGIRLATTIRATSNQERVNSFSIDIVIKNNEKDIEGRLTLLSDGARWETEIEETRAYQTNVLIEEKLINAMVYHCKKEEKEFFWITLLAF